MLLCGHIERVLPKLLNMTCDPFTPSVCGYYTYTLSLFFFLLMKMKIATAITSTTTTTLKDPRISPIIELDEAAGIAVQIESMIDLPKYV